MRKIFAVLGICLALALTLALPVSADTWYGWDGHLDKTQDGHWVYEWYKSDSWYRSYAFFVDNTGTSGMAKTSREGYSGFYFDSMTEWASGHWETWDIPLFQSGIELNSTASKSYIYTQALNLAGLPKGVKVTVTLQVTGSFARTNPDNTFDLIELYDIPDRKYLLSEYYASESSIFKRDGQKLPTTFEYNAQSTGGFLKYEFTATGDDVYNFAMVVNRTASLNYDAPFFVLPSISFDFTTEQAEEMVQIATAQLGVMQDIKNAMTASPELMQEIADKKEEQSRQTEEFSEAMQELSMPDIDISIPETVSLDPEGINQTSHIMSIVLGFPGVSFIVSTTASLWIVALLLFGKREGGAK